MLRMRHIGKPLSRGNAAEGTLKPAKRRRNARIVETVLAVLVERYPQCFVLLESKRRPLKVGIAADVIANHPDLKPSHIGVALHRYTRAIPYMAQLIEGTPRVGLDGAPAGAVSASEASHAIAKLKGRGRRVAKLPDLCQAAERRSRPCAVSAGRPLVN